MKNIILAIGALGMVGVATAVWIAGNGTDQPRPGERPESLSRVQSAQATPAQVAPGIPKKTPVQPTAPLATKDPRDQRPAEPPAKREPGAVGEEYSGKLLSQTVMPAEELIRQQEGKIPEKDRVELQKADRVAVLQPPPGKKILAFKDIKTENCAFLTGFQKPMAISVTAEGGLESAEYLRTSGDPVPPELWNCRFTASGEFKGKAFMTVYVPQGQ
jgi:hypothetical protein